MQDLSNKNNSISKLTCFIGNSLVTSTIQTAIFVPGSTQTITTAQAASTSLAPTVFDEVTNDQKKVFYQLLGMYLATMYLPILLAVTIRLFWQVIFAAMRMMEPFYQLARPDGNTARHTLLAPYLAPDVTREVITMAFTGNFVMLFGFLINTALIIVTTLAGESMTIRATAFCQTELSDHQPCAPAPVIDSTILRVVEGALIAMGVFIIALILLQRRRTSGVYSNPSRISTMADLLGHPKLMNQLQNIPPDATAKEVAALLDGDRYKFDTYLDANNRSKYGVTKIPSHSPGHHTSPSIGSAQYHAVSNPAVAQPYSPPPSSGISLIWLLLPDVLLLLILFTLVALIGLYRWTDIDHPVSRFFNSRQFGPKLALTILGIAVASIWGKTERELKMLEPYRHLLDGQATPRNSVDMSLTGTPLTTFFYAAKRADYVTAAAAFMAILSEVLIIAVNGIPVSEGTIMPAWLASVYISLGILTVMIIVVVMVMIRRFKDPRRFMPRMPDTPVAVWLYLCASNMTDMRPGVEIQDGDAYRRLSKFDMDKKMARSGPPVQNNAYGHSQSTAYNSQSTAYVPYPGGYDTSQGQGYDQNQAYQAYNAEIEQQQAQQLGTAYGSNYASEVEEENKRYHFIWTAGTDGKMRYVVEEELQG